MAQGTLLILLFLGLLIATFRDVKDREVPDLVSLGLVTLGLLGGLIVALLEQNVWVFVEHLCGFLAGGALGMLMFYARQWGGGDAKLMMGVGAVLGLSGTNLVFVEFVILMVFLGALYGIVYTIVLALRHRKTFAAAFKKQMRDKTIHRIRLTLVAIGLLIVVVFIFSDVQMRLMLGFLLIGLYLLVYSWIFITTIEKSCMLKRYTVKNLTEGDWIAEDVKVKGKLIINKKNTGVTKAQIAKLKRAKVRSVLVKEGIPFVPSFMLAYIGILVLWSFEVQLLWFF